METRKEKYQKYREQIQQTPDDQFRYFLKTGRLDDHDKDLLSSADKPSSAISYGSLLNAEASSLPSGKERSSSPYERFSRRRRISWILKICVSIIVVSALLVFYFLWVRR